MISNFPKCSGLPFLTPCQEKEFKSQSTFSGNYIVKIQIPAFETKTQEQLCRNSGCQPESVIASHTRGVLLTDYRNNKNVGTPAVSSIGKVPTKTEKVLFCNFTPDIHEIDLTIIMFSFRLGKYFQNAKIGRKKIDTFASWQTYLKLCTVLKMIDRLCTLPGHNI